MASAPCPLDKELTRIPSTNTTHRGWRHSAQQRIDRIGNAKSLRMRILAVAAVAMIPIIVIASSGAIQQAARAGELPTFLAWAAASAFPVLVGAAGVLAVSIVVESWILRWLDYLERVAKAYGKGRYSIRPHRIDEAPAEFRALGQALGDMAAAVEQRDKALRASLDEQTILLREVHHRVKNNLQIVGSLLSLQASRSGDAEVKCALQDAQLRLDAMSLAQRFMQDDEEHGWVSAVTMFEAWASQFRARMGRCGRGLDIRVDADDRQLPVEFAAPLVLIANEAVIQAYRRPGPDALICHVAVKDGPQGMIVLKVELTEADGGFDTARTMFCDLVHGYARQLRGQVEIPHGSRLVVTAPLAKPSVAEQSRDDVDPQRQDCGVVKVGDGAVHSHQVAQ